MASNKEKKIKALKDMIDLEEDDEAKAALQAQLNELEGKSSSSEDDDWLISDTEEDEYEGSAEQPDFISSFAQPGWWPCQFGEIGEAESDFGESFVLHFTCPAPGYEEQVPFFIEDGWMYINKEIFRGRDGDQEPSSKLKQAINALGLEHKVIMGKIAIRKSSAMDKVAEILFRVPKNATYEDPETGEIKKSTIAKPVAIAKMGTNFKAGKAKKK